MRGSPKVARIRWDRRARQASVGADDDEDALNASQPLLKALPRRLDAAEPDLIAAEVKRDGVRPYLNAAELQLDRGGPCVKAPEPKRDGVHPYLNLAELEVDRVQPYLNAVQLKLDRAQPYLNALQLKLDRVERALDGVWVPFSDLETVGNRGDYQAFRWQSAAGRFYRT